MSFSIERTVELIGSLESDAMEFITTLEVDVISHREEVSLVGLTIFSYSLIKILVILYLLKQIRIISRALTVEQLRDNRQAIELDTPVIGCGCIHNSICILIFNDDFIAIELKS